MRRTLSTLLFLAASCATASAARAEIAGTVRERQTGAPVAGARLSAPGCDALATSDAAGRFVLPCTGLRPEGVVVAHPAYRLVRVEPAPQGVDVVLEPLITVADHVEVTASRAREGTDPATTTNIPQETIARTYWGQDPAMLLAEIAPGFYAYNDGGNDIGYSYFSVRGFGQARTRVTLNGAPLNDAESGELFFIDLADFLATSGDVQLRRGVFGLSGIGGALDITTEGGTLEPSFALETAAGSYGTRRTLARYSSGLIAGRWSLTARYSRVSTDGYRDQSWVEMWNYYLSLTRYGERSRARLVLFGGPERTHLAYEGVPASVLAGGLTGDPDRDRRYNPITYPGEIDSFTQPHYQLVHELDLAPATRFAETLYAYRGTGSYDQYRTRRSYVEYNLPNVRLPDGSVLAETDLVRRRNVDEWDYGWVPTLSHDAGKVTWTVSGEARMHRAHHWGEVRWARVYPPGVPPDRRYYDYGVDKDTGVTSLAAAWRATPRVTVTAALQFAAHRYRLHDDRVKGVAFTQRYTFVLPRLGVVSRLGDTGEVYVNLARGMREPGMRDLYDPQDYFSTRAALAPEDVVDLEAGISLRQPRWRLRANVFWMDFRNAIVWAGGLDDNGVPIYANGPRARHRGFEFDGTWTPDGRWAADAALTVSRNTFTRYREYLDAATRVVYDGNRVAGYPDVIASVAARTRFGPLRLAMSVRHVGRFFLDNSEDNRRDPGVRDVPGYVARVNPAYTLVTVTGAFEMPGLARRLGASSLDLEVRLNNALDARYTAFGYVAGEPLFIPAAGRNLVSTVKIGL